MKKYLFVLTASLTLAIITLSTGVANAHSGNIIWDGLWRGVNLNFGGTSPKTTPAKPITPPPAAGYAALGDSVAAGIGLPTTGSPAGNDSRCKRSTSAYAYTVASSMNLPLVHVACSGAKAGDMFSYQGVSGPNIEPQLRTAFANGKPQLITITAGANDVRWNEFLRTCYSTNCATRTSTAIADAYLAALQIKLYAMFLDIERRSQGSPPTVVMTGYYNPLSPSCAALQTNVTAAEITWLTGMTDALNQTIQNVTAQHSYARFAPVDFTGRDICSAEPWVQGISAAAPFHPTVEGQQAIALSVLSSLAR